MNEAEENGGYAEDFLDSFEFSIPPQPVEDTLADVASEVTIPSVEEQARMLEEARAAVAFITIHNDTRRTTELSDWAAALEDPRA